MTKQQNKKSISIVLPVYNADIFLDATILSVLGQTYKDFEFVIVNHASTDSSKDIIEKYEKYDSRIVVLNLNCNKGGPAYPRNEGVKYATGQYISFIDSDDIWHKDKLMSIINYSSDYDIIYHNEMHFSNEIEDGKKIISMDIDNIDNLFEQLLLYGNIFSPSAITISREILLLNKFDEDINVQGVEDFDLWLRLAKKEYLYKYINEFLGYYRLHEEAFSKNFILQGNRERKILKKYLINSDINSVNKYRRLLRSIIANIYNTLKNRQKLNIRFYLKEIYDVIKS